MCNLHACKRFLNIILASVTQQVASVGASIGIKVNVVFLFLLTLKMSRVFEKTFMEGFSCVNTRLAFDTEVLINKNENKKVIFDLLIDGKKKQREFHLK